MRCYLSFMSWKDLHLEHRFVAILKTNTRKSTVLCGCAYIVLLSQKHMHMHGQKSNLQ